MAGLGSRGVQIAVGLVTVPLALGYLGREEYGLWVAVSSLVLWTSLFDFGMANGLVNALSESYGRDDASAASRYVSSAFFGLLFVAFVLGTVFALVGRLVPWGSLLNLPSHEARVVFPSVAAAVGVVLVGLPLGVVRQIYSAYQRSYISSIFTSAASLCGLAAFAVAVLTRQSLPVLILCYGVPGLVVVAANLIVALRRHTPWIRISLGLVDRGAFRRLSQTSIPLFLYQVGALLVNETDIVLLTRRAGLQQVTSYSVVMQIYVLLISLIAMSTNAFLPSFREAVERGEPGWARRAFRRMLVVRMGLAGFSFPVFLLLGNLILSVWLRRSDIHFQWDVWVLLSVLMMTATWVTAFTDVLTIMDRIWVQVGLVLFNGAVTAGLIYVLAPRYGVPGVLVALLCVSLLVLTWVTPLLARGVFGRPEPATYGVSARTTPTAEV